jgi:hypothetical protein
LLSNLLNGRDDVGVRTAAADVATHPLADLVRRPGVALLQQSDRGHDLAGRAVPALESVVLDKRGLDGVELITVRKTLNGCDFSILLHDREGETGIDAPPVDQHRAGPALAAVAAFLGSGQTQVLPERVEQRNACIDLGICTPVG